MKLKISIIITIHFLITTHSFSQECKFFYDLINEGDKAFDSGEYSIALTKYSLAKRDCPNKSDEAQNKIESIFETVKRLKDNAQFSEQEVQKLYDSLLIKERELNLAFKQLDSTYAQLDSTNSWLEFEKQKSDSALNKSQRLINSFYFYADNFALAYKDYFYYIDKNGKEITKLKRWEQASHFDKNGFAKVWQEQNNEYYELRYLDTLGNIYRVSNTFKGIRGIDAQVIHLFDENSRKIPNKYLFESSSIEAIIIESKSNKEFKLSRKVERLKLLRFLKINNRRIKLLPTTFGNLFNLIKLELSGNQLTSLDNVDFEQLIKLEYLDLSSNKLEGQIPKVVLQLPKLSVLYLDNNFLNEIPNNLKNLKNLKSLKLSNNKFKKLPQSLCNLKNLQYLDLSNNNVSIISDSIGIFTRLEYLNLSDNNVEKIPENLGLINNLCVLDLSEKSRLDFNTFCYAFKDYTKSVILSTENSDEIYDKKKLFVKISGIEINQSVELGIIQNLEVLNLSNNQVSQLPSNIGELKNLKVLNLSNNQVSQLPSNIGELKNLEVLNLSNNQVSQLPSTIRELKNLKYLDLTGNHNIAISQICEIFKNYHKNIGITTINKGYNTGNLLLIKISNQAKISPEISLPNKLIFLELIDNAIESIPVFNYNSNSLTSINLSSNKITTIPYQLLKLDSLKSIDLSQNDISDLTNTDYSPNISKILNLTNNNISLEQFIYLKIQLPNCKIISDEFDVVILNKELNEELLYFKEEKFLVDELESYLDKRKNQLDISKILLKNFPDNENYLYNLMLSYGSLANDYYRFKYLESDSILSYYLKATKIQEQLLQINPNNLEYLKTDYNDDLAFFLFPSFESVSVDNIDNALLYQNNYLKHVEELEKLGYSINLHSSYEHLAYIYLYSGDYERAKAFAGLSISESASLDNKAYKILAISQFLLGQKKDAKRVIRKIQGKFNYDILNELNQMIDLNTIPINYLKSTKKMRRYLRLKLFKENLLYYSTNTFLVNMLVLASTSVFLIPAFF